MRIGNIEIGRGAVLAPMAGVTDACFRPLCFEQGAAMAVSEMVSANGYLHMNRNDRAVRALLAHGEGEGCCGLQLFGHEPDVMAEAANQLQDAGFDFLDINMGCPTHKIVANGDGSALMKDPAHCGRITAALVRRSKLPVTVKIRAGWDEESVNAPQVARICADAGASAITVHGRTRTQFYAGSADWDTIAQVVRAVDVPVIGNGDVRCGADALRMLDQTGCAAVAVGRGAQGNPWIFRDILCALEGEAFELPSLEARVRMALRHMDMMRLARSERSATLEMRKHIAWYLQGARGCAQMRGQINSMATLGEVREALMQLLATAEPG